MIFYLKSPFWAHSAAVQLKMLSPWLNAVVEAKVAEKRI